MPSRRTLPPFPYPSSPFLRLRLRPAPRLPSSPSGRRASFRPVSLVLALLVLTSGCVTVRPSGPAGAPRPVPASARPARAPEARPAPRELPLGPLPEAPAAPSEPAPPDAAEPDGGAEPVAAPPERDAPEPPARHRASPGRPAHRAPAAAPPAPAAPAAKPRPRRPARPGPRPAPGRTPYDMTALCEAARGTVSPSIVALCH